ncbi:MAG: hypothetical protein HY000_09950 [Planctomycetes bacterium]|nr:hypothetical protein [Planctomycetota bacterium]
MAIPPRWAHTPTDSEADRVVEWARELYAQNPHWVQFHAALWGPGGALEAVFPERGERQAFLNSPSGQELQRLLAALRRRQDRDPARKPSVTVTVRVPKPLHEFLIREAAEQQMSLHRLCLAKLAQPLVDATDIQERDSKAASF